jgi:hypothetical protein
MRASATRKSGTSAAEAACAHTAAAEAASAATATATAGIRGVDRKCQREHRRDHNRAYQLECRHRTLLMSCPAEAQDALPIRIAGHTSQRLRRHAALLALRSSRLDCT